MNFNDVSKAQQKEIMEGVLKELLTAKGVSYRDFAPRMAWSSSQLCHIVKGNRNLDFLDWLALCKVLEVEPSEFLEMLETNL